MANEYKNKEVIKIILSLVLGLINHKRFCHTTR